jgi:hypothetical protein
MSSHTELKKAVRGTVEPSEAKAPQAANPSLKQAAYLPRRGRGSHAVQEAASGPHPEDELLPPWFRRYRATV